MDILKAITKLGELDQLNEMTQDPEFKEFREKFMRNLICFSDFNVAHAQTCCGYIYAQSLFDREVDVEKSDHYYKLSADQKYVWGATTYGMTLYQRGIDYMALALEYLKIPASKSDLECISICANILFEGSGISKDQTLARVYYKRFIDVAKSYPDEYWVQNKDLTKRYLNALMTCGLMSLKEGAISLGTEILNKVKSLEISVFSHCTYSKTNLPKIFGSLAVS